MTNTKDDLPESFSSARAYLVANLNSIINHLGYTPTSLAIHLSSISSSKIFSDDVTEWLSGNKLPNLYQLYKVSKLINMSLDSLFSSNFQMGLISNPMSCYCSGDRKILLSNTSNINTTNPIEENPVMATKALSVSISKSNKKKMDTFIQSRTSSPSYNVLLANKVYNSGMLLKDIAEAVGASTGSLRDYCLYNVTVPETIAHNLVKMWHTSYRNLGLIYNSNTKRYEHRPVTAK